MRSNRLAVLACISTAAALLCAAPAFAGGHAYGHDKNPQTLPVEGSTSAAAASQHQEQAAVAASLGVGVGGAGGAGGLGGAGGAGGGGGKGGDASAAGGAASVGDITVDAAPATAAASTGPASASIVDNRPRNPVATATARGDVGVDTCRFGPGAGFQGIAAGVNLSLPIFKDRDCATLAKVKALMALGRADVAMNYLERRDKEIAASAR